MVELLDIALVLHRIGMMFEPERDYAIHAEMLKREAQWFIQEAI